MKPRTIILLSAPRCGTSAVHSVFNKHPEVHAFFEPNFWSLAVHALEGRPEKLKLRFKREFSSIVLPTTFTEESIFALWDSILERYGPIVFEKTPFYLANEKALSLIKKYRNMGNDVRFVGLIRDPRDAITSQHELWGGALFKAKLKNREAFWLKKFKTLKSLQKEFDDFPLFRYEDLAQYPAQHFPRMFDFCEIRDEPSSYTHLKPVSVGRYFVSINPAVRRWKMGEEFRAHLNHLGYIHNPLTIKRWLYLFFSGVLNELKRLWNVFLKRRKRIKRRKTVPSTSN